MNLVASTSAGFKRLFDAITQCLTPESQEDILSHLEPEADVYDTQDMKAAMLVGTKGGRWSNHGTRAVPDTYTHRS